MTDIPSQIEPGENEGMKRIVVAVDFDEEIGDVLEVASGLAKDTGAELSVVHVYPPNPVHILMPPYVYPPVADEDDHEVTLQAQQALVREHVQSLIHKGVKASGYMKPEEKGITKSILAFAEEKEAELIVIGTYRPGRFQRLILGSIAEEVIRRSRIPVLVVPPI